MRSRPVTADGCGERSRRLAERQVLLELLVHDAPSAAAADPVESGDGPGREATAPWSCRSACRLWVGHWSRPLNWLVGPYSTMGDDVVDVAVIGRNAPGGVLTMTVADLVAANRTGEEVRRWETETTVDGPSKRMVSRSALSSHPPSWRGVTTVPFVSSHSSMKAVSPTRTLNSGRGARPWPGWHCAPP